MFYGYILQSSNTYRYYAGHAEDLHNRVTEHNAGESKSTREGIPWQLIHVQEFNNRSDAMKGETKVKSRGIERYLKDQQEKNSG